MPLNPLVTATALQSSGVSAIPLTAGHILAMDIDEGENVGMEKKTKITHITENAHFPCAETADLKDYPIEEVFKDWIKDDHVQRRLSGICLAPGAWEAWAQFEFEYEFDKKFKIPDEHRYREVDVYNPGKQGGDSEAADLVLPPTEKYKGMILELKCENKKRNTGESMKKLVEGDIEKQKELKLQYRGYTFRVLAMAFSEKAGTVIEGLGLEAIPDFEVDLKDRSGKKRDVLRVYQKNISIGSAGADEITQGLGDLSTDD